MSFLTLQYCLETLEQTCQCGQCDPCTRGQEDIRLAIRTLEDLLNPDDSASNVRYVLRRHSVSAEFGDRLALIQFVRDFLPKCLVLNDDATMAEIVAMAARNNWTIGYAPSDDIRMSTLLQSALNVIHDLLLTTELNMDDLEPETTQALTEATEFQNAAAKAGFHQDRAFTDAG